MDFDLPISDDEVDAAKQAVIEANDIVDIVRAYCWRGSEMMAVAQQTTSIWRLPLGRQAILTDQDEGITLDIHSDSPESAYFMQGCGLYMICMPQSTRPNARFSMADDGLSGLWCRSYWRECIFC